VVGGAYLLVCLLLADEPLELFDLVRRSVDDDEDRDEDEEDDDDDESTDYQIALQDLAASSQSLIAQVAQLAPHSPPDTKDLRNKLHISQTEVCCSFLTAPGYLNANTCVRRAHYGPRCNCCVPASPIHKQRRKPSEQVYKLRKTD
jgi:hypothetical protein